MGKDGAQQGEQHAGISDEKALQLQIALLLADVLLVNSTDSGCQEALQKTLALHNIAEFTLVAHDVCKFLVATTHPSVEFSLECKKSIVKLAPTVYIAIAPQSALRGVPTSWALNYQAPTIFAPDQAHGATVPGLLPPILERLPLQSLFNLLGQGYHVVVTGHGLGGQVAHALAAKLLLQLRQEIELARKMGINLSALSQTEDKVTSFSICGPLFGNEALGAGLSSSGLDGNLHTILRTGDAAPQFLMLCSELAIAASEPPPRLSSEGATAAPVAPFSLRSKPFLALQRWADVVCKEVGALERGKHLTLVTRPLDTKALHSSTEPGSQQAAVDSPHNSGSLPTGGQHQHAGSHDESGGVNHRVSGSHEALGTSPAPGSPLGGTGGGQQSSTSLPNSTRNSQAQLLLAGERLSPIRTSAGNKPLLIRNTSGHSNTGSISGTPPDKAPSPIASRASRSAAAVAAAGVLSAAAGGSKAGSPSAAAAAWRKTAVVASVLGTAASASAAHAGPEHTVGAPWQPALQAVLSFAPDGTPNYAPIGQFWLLEVRPLGADGGAAAGSDKKAGGGHSGSSKAGAAPSLSASGKVKGGADSRTDGWGAEERARLVSIPAARASALCSAWLSEGNKELFSCWETSCGELKKDLMEAFPWVMFKATATIDGQLVDRKHLVRPGKAVDLM